MVLAGLGDGFGGWCVFARGVRGGRAVRGRGCYPSGGLGGWDGGPGCVARVVRLSCRCAGMAKGEFRCGGTGVLV